MTILVSSGFITVIPIDRKIINCPNLLADEDCYGTAQIQGNACLRHHQDVSKMKLNLTIKLHCKFTIDHSICAYNTARYCTLSS